MQLKGSLAQFVFGNRPQHSFPILCTILITASLQPTNIYQFEFETSIHNVEYGYWQGLSVKELPYFYFAKTIDCLQIHGAWTWNLRLQEAYAMLDWSQASTCSCKWQLAVSKTDASTLARKNYSFQISAFSHKQFNTFSLGKFRLPTIQCIVCVNRAQRCKISSDGSTMVRARKSAIVLNDHNTSIQRRGRKSTIPWWR